MRQAVGWLSLLGALALWVGFLTLKGTNAGFDITAAVLLSVIYVAVIASIVWALAYRERKRQGRP